MKARDILIIIFIIAFFGISIYMNINDPEAKKVENELKIEFSKINNLPEAALISPISIRKGKTAAVGAKYSTALSFDEIRKFYDAEFQRNDWKFVKAINVTDWGRDYGGRILYYRKSNYRVSLQYIGNIPNAGWTYEVSVSWGFKE